MQAILEKLPKDLNKIYKLFGFHIIAIFFWHSKKLPTGKEHTRPNAEILIKVY